MADFNILNDPAFRVMELSEAVNLIPNQWGRIGDMGLFTPKPIRGTGFLVEMKNGVLQLVQSSTRGTPLPGQARSKRKVKTFQTERFGLKSKITAADIDSIRAYGSVSELKQVGAEIADRQTELRGSIDITREYLRAGALQGLVKDADGSTLIDLHAEFGVTKKSVDFLFGTAATDIGAKVEAISDHIRLNLMGDVMTGIGSLVSTEFWDNLMGHADFRERFKFYQDNRRGDPNRDNVSGGFEWKGIYWEKYLAEGPVPQEDGTTVTRRFQPANEAMFFPLGTRQTFRQMNGSADYMPMVNLPGLPNYSAVFPDLQEQRFVDVEAMMQTLPMCMRPGVLVRGHSSN